MSRRHHKAERRRDRRRGTTRLAALTAFVAFAAPASAATRDAGPVWAYLDPGAGSFILQAIVAGIAGAAVAVSAYWRRIKRFFGIEAEADPDREAAARRDE